MSDKLKIYLVGGAVRDTLLGYPTKERDWVVVGSTPEEMLKQGFLKVGKDFPVFLHPATNEEYALARTERKTGKGYYGFECHASPTVTLEEDLSRRDLTINAMAQDENHILIDPFNGQNDLKNKILRHVSPAFSEDPVRILRIARFLARYKHLGFNIADETMTLMKQMVVDGEIDELIPERVWKEMENALKEKNPEEFILTLKECGALERLWPSLNKLWGIPQTEKYHPEIDTGLHVMMALKVATTLTQDPETRFAVLCHDLGKGATPQHEWPSHKKHEERGVPLIKEFSQHYRIPSAYRDLAIIVSRFHLHCHKAFELRASTIVELLEKCDAIRQPDRFMKFLLACEADARGRGDKKDADYPQKERLHQALKIVKAVDIKPLLEAGLIGEKLGVQIRQMRIQAIKAAFTLNDEPDVDD